MDTVKTVERVLGNKAVFTFLTIASNCAPTTQVSVIYENNGEMRGLEFLNTPPVHAFANSQVIAEAPSEYLWAGIGDALSKEVESAFSSRGRQLSFEDQLGVTVVRGCVERIYQDGKGCHGCSTPTPSFSGY